MTEWLRNYRYSGFVISLAGLPIAAVGFAIGIFADRETGGVVMGIGIGIGLLGQMIHLLKTLGRSGKEK